MFQQAIISALAHQQRVRWQHPAGSTPPARADRRHQVAVTTRTGYAPDTEMAPSGHESTASWAEPSCPLGTSRV